MILLLVPLGPLGDRVQLQPSALWWILMAYYAEAMVFYIINLLEKKKKKYTYNVHISPGINIMIIEILKSDVQTAIMHPSIIEILF